VEMDCDFHEVLHYEMLPPASIHLLNVKDKTNVHTGEREGDY
jgi:hypothetical protein